MMFSKRMVAAGLVISGIAGAIEAQPIRLLEDRRRIDITAGPDFRVGPVELDTEPAAFGSDYLEVIEVSESLEGDAGFGLDTYTLNRAANQASVIEALPGGGLRVAAFLGASNSSEDQQSFVSRGARTASEFFLRLETDVPLTFELNYGVHAGGDESPGGFFSFDKFGGNVGGFAGGFTFDQIQRDAGATGASREFTISIDDGNTLEDVQVVANGYLAQGQLGPGAFTVSGFADAGHDADDPSGFARVAFELILTPVPEPAATSILGIGGLLMRRRRTPPMPSAAL